MTIRLTKPWLDLASIDDDELPAQLGVFQLGDAGGNVVYIGYAGGRDSFGLRTAIGAARAAAAGASKMRFEVTHGYLSRWEELMMIHHHDHGRFPPGNDDDQQPKGRLRPVAGG